MVNSVNNDNELPKQRRYTRVQVTNLLSYDYEHITDKSRYQGTGKTCSLSEGGLLFETNHPIEKGTAIELQFTLEDNLITAFGEVIYNLDHGNDLYGIGIRFNKINDAQKTLIQKYAIHFPRFEEHHSGETL